jgi:hypothetical protein
VNKAKLNYGVDLIIGIGFLLSSLSGLVFLLPGDPASGALGVGYKAWNDLHTFSSLLMIAGVGLHLLLHWKWIVNMTRRMVISAGKPVPRTATNHGAADGPAPQKTSARGLSRRGFLRLGAGALTGVFSLAVGYKIICDAGQPHSEQQAGELPLLPQSDSERTQVNQDEQIHSDAVLPIETRSDEPENRPKEQELGVACPFGIVNDPYPGRCRRYRDSDGDEFCDYSVPGSGTNRAGT